MSSSPRKTLTLKAAAPSRDPRRRPVRPGAPPSGGAGKGTGPANEPATRGPKAGARDAFQPGPKRAGAPPGRPGQPGAKPGSPSGPKPGPKPAAKPTRPAQPGHPKTPKPFAPGQHAREPYPPRADRPAAAASSSAPPATEGIRLSKQLADQGLASRREADEWIEAGWVRVDGKLAVLGQRVLPHQHIEIDPAAQRAQAQRVTILLNKPIGYVSGQAEDGYEPAAVLVTPENHWSGDGSRIPFHPGQLRGLAPAGRLDIDSTGLLVLTQDGRVAKLLIGEDSRVEKEYLVRVEPMTEGSVKPDALALLNHGLWLDDQPLKPAKVSWQNEHQLRFVLREGRKRQIRRMCELVGYKVTALRRVRIGSIVLGALPPGQWRYLGPHEKFI